jgi:hypothetical protein
MPKSQRPLVPDDQVIVVLDTAPARNLAYPHQSTQWAETYALMAKQGYSFSLSDGAAAELVEQRYKGALSAEDCSLMCGKLETFLNPELPVLLGKIDIGGMLGLNEVPWHEDESRLLSLQAWSIVKRCADPSAPQDSFKQELQDERDDWIGLHEGWQRLLDKIQEEDPEDPIDVTGLTEGILKTMELSQDRMGVLTPPMSVRSHLSNRYHWRQFARMQKKKEPYDPRSKNKINDGIDADLYHYLALPAFIVSEDGGFFGGLEDIESFQKNWFFRPQALAEEWQQGKNPKPLWR